jgi:hypothetical protein
VFYISLVVAGPIQFSIVVEYLLFHQVTTLLIEIKDYMFLTVGVLSHNATLGRNILEGCQNEKPEN